MAKRKRKRPGDPPGRNGRPPYEPTPFDRTRVRRLAAYGMTLDEIALLIENPTTGKPLTRQTLTKAYAHELKVGRPELVEKISKNVAMIAMSRSHRQAINAAKFYLTHQAGWSSKDEAVVEQERQTAGEKALEVIRALAEMDMSVGVDAAEVRRMRGVEPDPAEPDLEPEMNGVAAKWLPGPSGSDDGEAAGDE